MYMKHNYLVELVWMHVSELWSMALFVSYRLCDCKLAAYLFQSI